MKNILSFLIAFICSLTAVGQTSAPYESPKLVVGIVVDQMRYDYITRYWERYREEGFKLRFAKVLMLETITLITSQPILDQDTLLFILVQPQPFMVLLVMIGMIKLSIRVYIVQEMIM